MSGDLHPKHPREYRIHRPYWGECPPDLLCEDGDIESQLDWVRIAKHNDRVVAAYSFKAIDTFHYSLLSLKVDREYRRRGLGRWLLLHALGVIESKGGREVTADFGKTVSLMDSLGFVRVSNTRYQLSLDPEN